MSNKNGMIQAEEFFVTNHRTASKCCYGHWLLYGDDERNETKEQQYYTHLPSPYQNLEEKKYGNVLAHSRRFCIIYQFTRMNQFLQWTTTQHEYFEW